VVEHEGAMEVQEEFASNGRSVLGSNFKTQLQN